MTFPRFYYPGQITAGQVIELPTNTMHHAIRVLRLEPGSKVTLFNGKGGEFPAFIECIGKTGVLVLTENYPLGTSFLSAVPPPDTGNDTWNLGDIGELEEKEIIFIRPCLFLFVF